QLFLAHESGFSPVPEWSVESNQASAFFGWSVAGAGDVNGDGYDDWIAGAPGWNGGLSNEGRVTLYWGSPNVLSTTPAWTKTGGQAGANFGAALAGSGDADADGYADLVIGAPLQNSAFTDAGAIHWFRGSATGPSATAQRVITGTMVGEELGAAVAHAGDANGDGYADVIAGAPGFTHDQISEGSVRVILGSQGGLQANAWWNVEGEQAEARLGSSVAYAGDVNGDGVADILASARFYDGVETDEGRALLYLGSPSGIAALPAWSIEGNQAGAELDAVASAGDINADGFSDIAVGSSLWTSTETQEGVVHVYAGSANGMAASPLWTMHGGVAFANLGSSLGGAGDASGDGFADLVLGARGLADSAGAGGAVLLMSGNADPGSARNVSQWRALANGPIALRGLSDASNQFRMRATGRDPFGRGRVRFEIETKIGDAAFDG
ncbi:MAG TPA: integrin alpha, partial [bacterium]|nr:integrin alpha [bacterium]